MLKPLRIELYIQPNAKQFEVCGLHDRALKIKIPAPATDDKANNCLIKIMAQQFNAPMRCVEIIKGHKSRYKTVVITEFKCIPKWYEDYVKRTTR